MMRGNLMNNIQLLSQPVMPEITTKPVELYVFIDPLCKKALHLMTNIRKLHLQYGHYFTSRFVLSTELSSLNAVANRRKGCCPQTELDIMHPVLPSIAIKAAELQGKRAGQRYLLKLQQYAMMNHMNLNSHATLLKIANEINLDLEEFASDFGSKEAAKAFQCDLYITREMEVNSVPSVVFFNECIEEEGLNVSGNYDYHVYEHILFELIGEELVSQPLPPIDQLFEHFEVLTTNDIATIYNLEKNVAERELKKRMLQQKIERLPCQDTDLWKIKL